MSFDIIRQRLHLQRNQITQDFLEKGQPTESTEAVQKASDENTEGTEIEKSTEESNEE